MSEKKEPLTDEHLAAIRSRLNGVSLGEWINGYSLDLKCNTITCEGRHLIWFVHPDPLKNDKNMEFVASARKDMGALLEEVERMRVENQRLEKSIDWLVSKRFPCPRDGSQCYKEIAIRNNTTYAENVCEQHWRDAALRAVMKEEEGKP